MRFPDTNKQQKEILGKFGDSASILEKYLSQVNWRKFFSYYFVTLVVFLVTLFSIIVVIKFALWLI